MSVDCFGVCYITILTIVEVLVCLTTRLFWDGAATSWAFGTLKCLAQGHFTAVVVLEPYSLRSPKLYH